MRHLIIYAHPNENSLNHSVLKTVVENLEAQYHEIVIRDLYTNGFDPVLSLTDMQGQRMGKVSDDVKLEQDYISWAEQITFIYPIWWTGLPAIMKGYIDRVFSYGFAYCYDQGIQKGLLKGKKLSSSIRMENHRKNMKEQEWIKPSLSPLTMVFLSIPDWRLSSISSSIKLTGQPRKILKSGKTRSEVLIRNFLLKGK